MSAANITPSQVIVSLGLTPLDGRIELPIFEKIRAGFAYLAMFIGTPEHQEALKRCRAGEINRRELFRLGWEYAKMREAEDLAKTKSETK